MTKSRLVEFRVISLFICPYDDTSVRLIGILLWKIHHWKMRHHNLFEKFIQDLESIDGLTDKIIDAENLYKLKKYKITELSQDYSLEIYRTIV